MKQSGDRQGCEIMEALMLSQLQFTKSGARLNLQSLSIRRRLWAFHQTREIPRSRQYGPWSSAVRPIFVRQEFEL